MANETPLFDGEIQANKVGGFIKNGMQFDVIRPGYDAQGRRHKEWTQVAHEGVPVYTVKLSSCTMSDFLRRFDVLWDKHFGDGDPEHVKKCFESNRKSHLRRFKDGVTGETIAPTHTQDGPMMPKVLKPS